MDVAQIIHNMRKIYQAVVGCFHEPSQALPVKERKLYLVTINGCQPKNRGVSAALQATAKSSQSRREPH
ncbi:hypothetical protein [Paraherbaspirillum soli]|uniref:Transposase n=1 Tax=Paraherbaspirillum soli TaxID=631222 RepID=A0ABW0MF53_9BURK